MAGQGNQKRGSAGIRGVSYRRMGGVAIAAVMVLFVALNRNETEILFIVFSANTALWVALTAPQPAASLPDS